MTIKLFLEKQYNMGQKNADFFLIIRICGQENFKLLLYEFFENIIYMNVGKEIKIEEKRYV